MFGLSKQHKAHHYPTIISPKIKVCIITSIVALSFASGYPEWEVQAQTVVRQQQKFVRYEKTDTIQTKNAVIYTDQIQVIAITEKKLLVSPTPRSLARSTSITQQSILEALNEYRKKNGKPPLAWDGKLAAFAQERAEYFSQKDDLDNHDGFRNMMQNNGFERMGFYELGENSGIGHNTADSVALIEHIYGSSPGHNENQLSPNFTHVGIGVSGTATNFVFGGSKR
jgi:uncharacterized protein YkwD